MPVAVLAVEAPLEGRAIGWPRQAAGNARGLSGSWVGQWLGTLPKERNKRDGAAVRK